MAMNIENILSALQAQKIRPEEAEKLLCSTGQQDWSSNGGRSVTLGDMQMYFEVHGEGQPLILLHGWGVTGTVWRAIFKNPPSGYQLVVPDLRGHGRSTNSGTRLTHRQFALDIFLLLDHLEIRQFKAVGLSSGANTLLHMATQQPARVEAMVLVGATSYFPTQTRVMMHLMNPNDRSEKYWQYMRQSHKHGDQQIRALLEQGNLLKDDYDDMNFTPPYLSTITASTLIVHGDRDAFYPINIPVELHAAIRGSYLWVVPHGGHLPVILDDYFVKTILAFLRGDWKSEPAASGDDAGFWSEFWAKARGLTKEVVSSSG